MKGDDWHAQHYPRTPKFAVPCGDLHFSLLGLCGQEIPWQAPWWACQGACLFREKVPEGTAAQQKAPGEAQAKPAEAGKASEEVISGANQEALIYANRWGLRLYFNKIFIKKLSPTPIDESPRLYMRTTYPRDFIITYFLYLVKCYTKIVYVTDFEKTRIVH